MVRATPRPWQHLPCPALPFPALTPHPVAKHLHPPRPQVVVAVHQPHRDCGAKRRRGSEARRQAEARKGTGSQGAAGRWWAGRPERRRQRRSCQAGMGPGRCARLPPRGPSLPRSPPSQPTPLTFPGQRIVALHPDILRVRAVVPAPALAGAELQRRLLPCAADLVQQYGALSPPVARAPHRRPRRAQPQLAARHRGIHTIKPVLAHRACRGSRARQSYDYMGRQAPRGDAGAAAGPKRSARGRRSPQAPLRSTSNRPERASVPFTRRTLPARARSVTEGEVQQRVGS